MLTVRWCEYSTVIIYASNVRKYSQQQSWQFATCRIILSSHLFEPKIQVFKIYIKANVTLPHHIIYNRSGRQNVFFLQYFLLHTTGTYDRCLVYLSTNWSKIPRICKITRNVQLEHPNKCLNKVEHFLFNKTGGKNRWWGPYITP